MLKLTRLNNRAVAINPDHISWVESTPDTTLFLINGEKLIVRETLEELIEAMLRYRRAVRCAEPSRGSLGPPEGDPPRFESVTPSHSTTHSRVSAFPHHPRGGGR